MKNTLLLLAASLVLLGWWSSTLGKTEIQGVLSAQLVISGMMLSAFSLVGDWLMRSSHD
jgi:hypothetical protein